jgi:hypothetical protein
VVGLATLVEGYGWFGAGVNGEDGNGDGNGDEDEAAGTDGGGGDERQADDGGREP